MQKIALWLVAAALLLGSTASWAHNDTAPASPAVSIDVGFTAKDAQVQSVSGLAHRGIRRLATAKDPVRVASISKLAVALAVMRLVDQGKLDLDRDVGAILGWPVRHPNFPDTVITLRLLLSHQSSLTDSGGYILPMDGSLQAHLAQDQAWDAARAPGSYFRYANVNWPVIAAVMEAATGERFDQIMAKQLFEPLGLEACFNWSTCAPEAPARAITLYRPNGDIARDDWLSNPAQCALVASQDGSCDITRYRLGQNGSTFSPQGGMRISAVGLARIGQVMLSGGQGLLSPEAFAEMTRPSWKFDGTNGDDDKGYFTAFGLGVQIITDQTGTWLGHPGEAYGLRAGLWINPAQQRGIVRIVTGVAEDAPIGHCLHLCP